MKFQASILILLGSSLIFLIQPSMAKLLLPTLGGSPIVWNYCLFFFQTVLFAGYLYAHLLTNYFQYLKQTIIHSILLLAGILFYFLIDGLDGGDLSESHILLILLQEIGLPYFLLCTGSVLIQKWYSEITQKDSAEVYHLYFVSNLASFITLLSFPILIEVYFSSTDIINAWYFLFSLWVMGNLIYLFTYYQLKKQLLDIKVKPVSEPSEEFVCKPNTRAIILWFSISFIATGLLFAVTTHITTDIAAVPFFWIIPLSLYLMTFMIVFDRRLAKLTSFSPHFYIPGMIIILIIMLVQPIHAFWWVFHIIGYFLIAFALHGKLSLNKPHKKFLSLFYLIISFGSSIAGFFIIFIAPNIFNQIIEYPLLLLMGGLLMGFRFKPNHKFSFKKNHLVILLQAIILACITISLIMVFDHLKIYQGRIRYMITIIIPIMVSLLRIKHIKALSLFCLIIWGSHHFYWQKSNNLIYQARNHFGISRIKQFEYVNKNTFNDQKTTVVNDYFHGSINHGGQLVDPKTKLPLKNSMPLYYFHRKSPFGEFMKTLPLPKYQKIAIFGLGTGNIASYANKNQQYDFFEINPHVISIAKNEQYFSYLKDAKQRGATINIIKGDARLQIKANNKLTYDLIIMDAFSGDSIPVHLMTKEAIRLYMKKSSKDALIAFHITNSYIELKPVLTSLAKELDLQIISKSDYGKVIDEWQLPTSWVIFAKQSSITKKLFITLTSKGWVTPLPTKGFKPWTDQYSNLFKILIWK